MLDSVTGKLVRCGPAHAVIDTGSFGLRMTVPFSTYERIQGKEQVSLLTHLHVQQDAMRLYGFATEAERDVFSMLISVSDIGPTKAVRILSGISVPELKECIVRGDAHSLEKIKGVGPKTAQRLVVELREAMARLTLPGEPVEARREKALWTDVVDALVSLGDKKSEAESAVGEAMKSFPRGGDPAELLRIVLQARGRAGKG
jgi:Holliday junction DNA helicase RuvA